MKNFEQNRYRLLKVFVGCLDFLCFQAALLVGFWLWISFPWHGNYQYFSDYSLILWILPPIAIVVFNAVGLYEPEMGVIGVQEQSLIFKAVWIVYFIVFAASFFYREVSFSRLATFYSIFIALFFLSLARLFIRALFSWLNRKGIASRYAFIFGAGYHGQRLERWIRQSPQLGIQVVGFLDNDVEKLTKKPEAPAYLGPLSDLKSLAEANKISLLFIAHRQLNEEQIVDIFQRCRDLGIQCWAIPSLYRFRVEKVQLRNIGGIPLVGFREAFSRRSYIVVKRGLDIIIGSLLLLIALPLMGAIAIGIYVTAGQPIFFKQTRVGIHGKKFVMYKFRTLKQRKKDELSPELQKDAAPAYLPMGKILRRTGLDELPQLINVLGGEMSLVGPRPEMPFLVEKYDFLERERLTVKPGITGLWQVSEDRKRLLIHENMDYDLYYIEHLSFNLDLAILAKTFTTIVKRLF